MALEGHWVAADGAGVGTTLPDRSGNARHGTLTAGCTWGTVAGEPAVNCPGADRVEVPDLAAWNLADHTIFARASLPSVSSQPGLVSHNDGPGGGSPKWVTCVAGSGNSLGVSPSAIVTHVNPGSVVLSSPSIALVANTVYVFVERRIGSNWTYWIYNQAGTLLTTGTSFNSIGYPDASVPLMFGWGGEPFFNGTVDVIAIRIESAGLTDSEVDRIAKSSLLTEGAGATLIATATISGQLTTGEISALLTAVGIFKILVILADAIILRLEEPISNVVCTAVLIPTIKMKGGEPAVGPPIRIRPDTSPRFTPTTTRRTTLFNA